MDLRLKNPALDYKKISPDRQTTKELKKTKNKRKFLSKSVNSDGNILQHLSQKSNEQLFKKSKQICWEQLEQLDQSHMV